MTELASDLLPYRPHLCATCRGDLTPSLTDHLASCDVVARAADPVSWARSTTAIAREVRKRSVELQDVASVARAESEALRDEARLATARSASQRWPVLAGVRVVLVEDDEDQLRLFSTALVMCGAIVATASCASAAVQLWDRFKPAILISDIVIPDDPLLVLAKAVASEIPSIAITAGAAQGTAGRILEQGFMVCLLKPLDPLELCRAVASLCAGRLA